MECSILSFISCCNYCTNFFEQIWFMFEVTWLIIPANKYSQFPWKTGNSLTSGTVKQVWHLRLFEKDQSFIIAQFPGKSSFFSSCQFYFWIILCSPQRPRYIKSLCKAMVAHSAVKLILPYIYCLFFGNVKSLAYCSIGHLRSKICFIAADFSFSGMTPLWWYHKEKSSRCLPNISGRHTASFLLYW